MVHFSYPVRVFYEDTDAAGYVYHSMYLNYAERSRTEMLRSIGVEQTTMRNELACFFVVKSANVKFIKPAVLDDLLLVELKIRKVNAASVEIYHEIKRDDELISSVEVIVVCVNLQGKPQRIPKEVRLPYAK